MRHTDLELYRWKFHNTVYAPSVAKHQTHVSRSGWWREHGAFVSVLPRGCGKTSIFIKTIINEFKSKAEHYMVVAHNSSRVKSLAYMLEADKHVTSLTSMYNDCFNGCATMDVHLVLDEFMLMDDTRRNILLDNDWKSVTMISSLK